jgi:hypothetical protein
VILAGCASDHRPPAPPTAAPLAATPAPPPPTVQPEPEPPSGAGFFFNRDHDRASLAYGLPESDAVLLMLSCRRGARRVEITDAAHTPKTGQSLILISQGARSEFAARIAIEEGIDGAVAHATAPTDAPALLGFRKSGQIAFELGGHRDSLSAAPSEMVAIDRFFGFCDPAPHRLRGRR